MQTLLFSDVYGYSTLVKSELAGRVEGKRSQARPRRRWVDDIKEWLQMSVVKAGGLAQDRDAYRGSVRAATRRGPTHIADSAGGGSRGSPTR